MAALMALAPIVFGLLAASALFSAAETAMTGASRARMHQLERDGDRAAHRVNRLLGDREMMIGAVLLGNNIFNILATELASSVFAKVIPGAWGVAAATAVMTVLILVFAEILPKTLAILRSDDIARLLAFPTYLVVRLFGPIIFGVQYVIRGTLKLFGVHLGMEMDVLAAHEEIRGAVEYHHAEGLVESHDRWMLGGVLDLAEMDVGEVMVHRNAIATIDADQTPAQIVDDILQSGHSRVPLYRDEPENIVGVLHNKDLLAAIAEAGGRIEAVDMAAIIREPWFIPETTSLKDQLAAFLKRRIHFALVVDEYGALQGLVTLEDILEEIVGEIEDEHDVAMAGLRPADDGSVLVDGSLTIRDLNRAMNWDLPDDEAVTVAGLLIHEARRIPESGQSFHFHHHRISVLERKANRITRLQIWPRDERQDD
ncbi:HlyC/CorC family transporter [Phenylobacterium sp.]|jgi:Mg2+/Co2+ transporter CorB|uniref:HlyC/CorC family transporter n=1 Tax=Phenylobacterium sp. TaxID=1871053 RepID=UPI0039C94BD5